MNRLTLAVACLTATLSLAPDRAHAQTACEVYRVKQGDTLREIARAAYGTDVFRPIWRANRAEIGRNPNIISIGTVLRLPCADGSLPTAAAPPAAASADTISFVTANGYLPYTDESLHQRGLVTHLVSQAMIRAEPEQAIDIVFVNDWASHLEQLLPRQAFDASFPWTRPGCETQGELTSVELYACQNYLYSDPLYEIVEGFFSRAGSGHETLLDFASMRGLTLCRPEGYATGHLEENGLMPPAVTLVQPAGTHECFSRLMAGQVDIVALDTRAGERVMGDIGMTFDVVENPHLYSIQPLQVAVHRDNPRGEEIVTDINRGLRTMMETGEWASIVTDALQEQAEALMN
ncbi:MAG: transporter substrate-binding domain-containing protein [Pseudomonadota bacterium]